VVLEPSIKLAQDGFPVGVYLANSMAGLSRNEFLYQDPDWAVDFAPNGTLAVAGDIITRKRYAATLQKIAQSGPGGFYSGPIAEQMVKAVQGSQGIMTLSDLGGYEVLLREPSEIQYRGYRVVSTSAPSGGPVVLSALKIVEGYSDFGSPSARNLSTHRFDEALRFGYGQVFCPPAPRHFNALISLEMTQRTELGDPAFVPTVEAYQQKIIDGETSAEIREAISDEHTLPVEAYNPKGLEVLPT